MMGGSRGRLFRAMAGMAGLLYAAVLLWPAPARAEKLPPLPDRLTTTQTPSIGTSFGTSDSRTLQSLSVAQLQGLAAQKLNRDFISKFLGPLPAWVQRIEVTGNFDLDGWRGLEVMTVQPLWRAEDKRSVVFTQLSVTNYRMFDKHRFAGNAGMGYRTLALDGTMMLGVNAFYDYEFLQGHHRTGIGGEIKYGPLDFTANGYLGLNQRSVGGGSIERVPNGLDFELGSQVPYMPWARAYGKYYVWDHKLDDKPVHGTQLAAEASLHRHLSLESGARRDMGGRTEGFFMLRIKMNTNAPDGLFDGAPLLDNRLFAPRNLSRELLSKVRRENRIILERSNPMQGKSGVTVAVGRRH